MPGTPRPVRGTARRTPTGRPATRLPPVLAVDARRAGRAPYRTMAPMITVSTDGSCLRNPGGAIGWAWANHDGTSASGGAPSGTNQVAELTAVLEAVRAHPGPEPLRIEADSQYAIKCSSEWVHGWRRRGWRTASGGPVQNLALVQAIDQAIRERTGPVTFSWVRGHRGDRFNERADELAGIAARAARAGTLPPPPTPAPPTPTPTVDSEATAPTVDSEATAPTVDAAVVPGPSADTRSNPGLVGNPPAEPVLVPASAAGTRSNPGLVGMDPLF